MILGVNPSVVQGGSGRYQPAKQPAATQRGFVTGQNSLEHVLTNETLETSAGNGLGQSGSQQVCVCGVHGAGAKWK